MAGVVPGLLNLPETLILGLLLLHTLVLKPPGPVTELVMPLPAMTAGLGGSTITIFSRFGRMI